MQELAHARTSAELIRERRAELGLTQQALAARAELALATVVRAERGDDFTIGTIRAIARALDVRPAELVGDDA